MVVCTLVLRRVTYSSSAAPALESDPLFLPSFEFLASMDGKRPKGATRLIEWHQTLLLVDDFSNKTSKNKKRQKSSRVNLATTSIRTLPLLFFLETARTSSNERARLRKWLGNLGFRYCDVFDG